VTVTHTLSPIVSSGDYYPFGLTFNSYSRENSTANKFKFQGQEHIDDLDLGWDSFKWRNHQPDIGRFFNIDPLADSYVYNSPYAFSENHVTSHVELEGLEKISIHSASFAPFNKFGGSYKGDGSNRKFGTDPSASSRIRGTPYLNVTGQGVTRYQQSVPKGSESHDLDTGEKTYSEARMTTKLSDSKGDGTNASAKFGFHVSGNNDLVPGSWDIDAQGSMNISTVQGENGSVITFSGKISGDGFPANETFISDVNGTGVFLGVSGADGNPYTTLAGDNNRTMSEFNISVNFNKDGAIQSVMYNGTTYSVADWNKQFVKEDPQSDVKTKRN
jgi:RHS repeat-associated protein